MKKTIAYLTVALILSTLILLSPSSAPAHAVTSYVSIASSGFITPKTSNDSTKYTYIFQVSGSEYQALNGSTNSLIYESTSSSTAWNYLFDSSGIAASGSSINILSGSYQVDGSWNIRKSHITAIFSSSTDLTEKSMASVSSPWTGTTGGGIPMMVVYGNNAVISGGVWNGNGMNQLPSPTTEISGSNHNDGIQVEANNCLIEYGTYYNIRCYGIASMPSNYGMYSENLTVMNITMYDVGANGISCSVGSYSAETMNVVNCNISLCGDVGIDTYGNSVKVTGNLIYDMGSAYPLTLYGYNDGGWAFGQETGGASSSNYALIANNTITGCNTGVACQGTGTMSYILVSGNHISSASWCGVLFGQSGDSVTNSIVEYNTLTSCNNGIDIENGANNDVYGNSFSNCQTNIQGSGYSTSQPTLVALTVTSSPNLVDAVTANGTAGYAGSSSMDPYTFYASVGGSVNLVANAVSGYLFSSWSDSGAQSHTIAVPSSDQTYTATLSTSI